MCWSPEKCVEIAIFILEFYFFFDSSCIGFHTDYSNCTRQIFVISKTLFHFQMSHAAFFLKSMQPYYIPPFKFEQYLDPYLIRTMWICKFRRFLFHIIPFLFFCHVPIDLFWKFDLHLPREHFSVNFCYFFSYVFFNFVGDFMIFTFF